ncbi:hypothetical protein GEMRC1_007718 [Eukaryota sp. GEM-RC1]
MLSRSLKLFLFYRLKEHKLLLVGLNSAGKSSILHKLNFSLPSLVPHVNVDIIRYKKLNIYMFDVPSNPNFQEYLIQNSDAVMFVVDTTDELSISCGEQLLPSGSCFQCARCELHRLMGKPAMSDAVLLVYANKQDLGDPMAVDEVEDRLQLSRITNKWIIQPCSAVTGVGLYEGFDFLATSLSE